MKEFFKFVFMVVFIPFLWTIPLYKKFISWNIEKRYQTVVVVMCGICTLMAYQAYGIFEKGMNWKNKYETSTIIVKNQNTEINQLKAKLVAANDKNTKAASREKTPQDKSKNSLRHNTLSNANNNLLNVKACGYNWQGGVGVDKHDHVRFTSYEYSIRAGAKTLFSYMTKHNIGTINGIVHRFSTNNHTAYAKYLSEHMHLGKDEKFNIIKRLPELLQYMSEFETGEKINRKYFVAYDLAAQVENHRQTKIARLEQENQELKKQLEELKKGKREVASK